MNSETSMAKCGSEEKGFRIYILSLWTPETSLVDVQSLRSESK